MLAPAVDFLKHRVSIPQRVGENSPSAALLRLHSTAPRPFAGFMNGTKPLLARTSSAALIAIEALGNCCESPRSAARSRVGKPQESRLLGQMGPWTGSQGSLEGRPCDGPENAALPGHRVRSRVIPTGVIQEEQVGFWSLFRPPCPSRHADGAGHTDAGPAVNPLPDP